MQSSINFFKRLLMMAAGLLVFGVSFSQDKKIDVNINTDSGGGFFASPWIWVVGAAVFILLLVALLRGGGRKEA